MRMLAVLLIAAVVIYLAICAGLFLLQRSLLYFPQPRSLGTQALERFQRGDALLHLTVRPHAGPGAVLYFGGNGEDVSGSIGALITAFPDREIVMLHYRGYGGSAGRPTEADITADAAALFDRVHAEHPDVVVIGRSLGSGVAVRLASTRPVARLVLVTPFDSLLELAVGQFRAFPVRLLLLDRYESWRYVSDVSAPTLILAADQDEIIPIASTQRLGTRFPPARLSYVVVPRTSHNTIADSPDYPQLLASVLAVGAAPR